MLLPYAVLVVLVFSGQDAAQNLVDDLAASFLLVPLFVIASLPINLATAFVLGPALGGASRTARLALGGAIFGGIWFFAIDLLLAPTEFAAPYAGAALSIWAAAAGAVYGVVRALAEPVG